MKKIRGNKMEKVFNLVRCKKLYLERVKEAARSKKPKKEEMV